MAFITDLKVLEVVEVRSAVTCWLLEHGPPRNTNFQLKIENLFSQYIAVSNPAPLTLNVSSGCGLPMGGGCGLTDQL